VVNSAVGGGFDLSRFEFRTIVDAENSRVETHVVARRAHELEVPGVCTVRLRKGESIRTSVRCVFERNRVAAMLTGVGLSLRHWNSDAEGRYVVALAAPAV
jgi:L-histidine Nalpha-methyltransferase